MKQDYDVVVIGSGPGGYVAAIRAAQLGLKTACVEKDPVLGGTCLNVGCIPSKCLLHSSQLYAKIVHGVSRHGIEAKATFNFQKMMERKNQVVSGFNSGIEHLFKKNQVTRLTGAARFTSSESICVNDQEIRAKHFILATGSVPMSLPFLPFDEKRVLSSTGALALSAVPKEMVVIGAGVIGVELGSMYSRLGTAVEFVEFFDAICPTLDSTVSRAFEKILTKQGMTFHLSSKVTGADVSAKGVKLTVEKPDKSTVEIRSDVVLVAIGRCPYTKGLELERAGVETDRKGAVLIDDNFKTTTPHIYAIGDLVDGPMLAHKASEEGYVVAELIAGNRAKIEYIAIPSVIYTHPEVAVVGLTEEEAKARHISYKKTQVPFTTNSRARCAGEEEGFMKLISDQKTGILLGVHILSSQAGELIAEAVLALEKRITAKELAQTCHAHPTLSESLKEGACSLSAQPLHL